MVNMASLIFATAIPHWSTLRPGSQVIYYNYRFCNNCFCTCFLHWCAVFHCNNLRWKWGCSMAVLIKKSVKEAKWSSNCSKNSNYNWLFGYLMEAKNHCGTVRIGWGHFATKSVGGGGGGLSPLPDFFSFCCAFERMKTSKRTQIERTDCLIFVCIMY